MDDKDRENLIKYRLEQAQETISDVQLLIDNNRLRSAVNRIYYGMFYALLALGLAYKFETSKHGQLIGWFNKSFIQKELIDKVHGRKLNKAYNRRTKGDYDTYVKFERDNVIEMFNDMKAFIAAINKFLRDSRLRNQTENI